MKILLTGAYSGIGKAIRNRIPAEYILVDKDTVDFTDLKAVETFSKNLPPEKIDVLINLAGIGVYKTARDISIKEWIDSIKVNLIAPFILIKSLRPLLEKSDNPFVINIGSRLGTVAERGMVAYCASKHGLRGMSLSLYQEHTKTKYCYLTLGSVMTHFGTGGMTKRKELQKAGKKYFTPQQVAERIHLIIKRRLAGEIRMLH